jgi:hypothetical protein
MPGQPWITITSARLYKFGHGYTRSGVDLYGFGLDLSATRDDDRVGSSTKGFTLDERHKTMIRRRDLLLAVTASGAAAAIGAPSIPAARAVRPRDKRKPQYQANSVEVQTYYRVNRYPAK